MLSINAIADKLTPAARASLLQAMRAMSQQVSIPALTAAIKQGNIGAALTAIKATQLPQHLKPFGAIIGDVFQQAASATMEPFVKIDPAFKKMNPLAQAAADWSGQKITLITDETRQAVRVLIRKGLTDGIEPKRLAKEIKPLVGLNARQAIAVQNARASWAASGMTQESIDKAAERLIEKKRKYRALMIARTETIGSSNRGQLHGWRAGAKAGMLDPAVTRRKWIAAKGSGRTCPLCNSMHGTIVNGLHDTFATPKGPLQHPPLHPNCRCTIGLIVTPSRSVMPPTFSAPPIPEAVAPPQAVMPDVGDYAAAMLQQQASLAAAEAVAKALKKQKAKEAQARFRAKKKAEREAAKTAAPVPSDHLSYDEFTKADQILQASSDHDDRVNAKINIQYALHERLKRSTAQVRISTWDRNISDYQHRMVPMNQLSEQEQLDWIRERIDKWAGTSGDSDPSAVAMQMMIRDEFGLQNADMSHFSSKVIQEALDVVAAEGEAYRAVAREMYNHTQEYFQKRGITHVTVVRGANYPTAPKDGWGEAVLQPASSFSTHIKTSIDFGRTMHVVRAPITQVLGTARTGFGCLEEHEFVLLGGRLRAWNSNRYTDTNSFTPGEWERLIEDAIKKGTPP